MIQKIMIRKIINFIFRTQLVIKIETPTQKTIHISDRPQLINEFQQKIVKK